MEFGRVPVRSAPGRSRIRGPPPLSHCAVTSSPPACRSIICF